MKKLIYLKSLMMALLLFVGVSANATDYELVTSTSQLVAGCKYIIGSAKATSAVFMSTTENTNNRKQSASATITSSKVTLVSDMLVLTLGGSEGAWTFSTFNYAGTDGYLNATNTTSNNYLKVIAADDKYNKFSISFSNDAAVITCTGKSSRNIMRYNSSTSGGQIFTCYSSGQNPVYLFKEVKNTKTVKGIAIKTPPTKTTYVSGEKLDLTGLVLTVTYSDDSTEDITAGYTASPANNSAVVTANTQVTITYQEKTTTQAITVNQATPVITADDVNIEVGEIAQLGASSTPTATITYTLVSGGEYIDLADNMIEAKAVGTAVIRATTTATTELVSVNKEFNVVVSAVSENATLDFSKATYASADASAVTWNWDYVTVAAAKGGATTAPNNYLPTANGTYTSSRFYKNSTLTITPVSGLTVKKIVFTATSDSYTTALAGSTYTNATASGNTTTKEVTITPTNGANAITIKLGNTVGVEAMKIYYTGGPTSASITVTSAGYATYYNSSKAFTLPTGMTASVWSDGLQEMYTAGQVVPAGEPVVLKAAATDYTLNFTTDPGNSYKSQNMNDLEGSDTQLAIKTDSNSYFYGLSLNKAGETSSVGFYWMNETGAAFTNGAHKAYLKLAKTSGAKAGFPFNEDVDAINAVHTTLDINAPIYNIAGQRVSAETKGILIQNGRKFINK